MGGRRVFKKWSEIVFPLFRKYAHLPEWVDVVVVAVDDDDETWLNHNLGKGSRFDSCIYPTEVILIFLKSDFCIIFVKLCSTPLIYTRK